MARSPLLLLHSLLCTMLTLFSFAFQPTTLHIDPLLPVTPAATETFLRWPLVCDPALRDVVQFRWVATEGEVVDRGAVEAQLRGIAQQVNWFFWRDSDGLTEARLPAWKVTADCRLDVQFGDVAAGGTIPQLRETKLIQIESTDDFCGFAYLAPDDRPGAGNIHNQASFAVVSRQCLSAYVVAHELLHSIGAVQPGAPHGTEDFHSREYDIMGRPEYDRCGAHDKIDCGNDDYFSLSPAGYLADHWNSADSVFLVSAPRYTVWLPLGKN